ncbi:MAG: hypothetical protein ACJ749_06860, partial [Flavisolibacter sp.]
KEKENWNEVGVFGFERIFDENVNLFLMGLELTQAARKPLRHKGAKEHKGINHSNSYLLCAS